MIPPPFSYSDVELEEDEREEEEPLKPVGIPYKEDVCTPVYSWSRKAYSCKGLVRLLLQDYEPEFLCISQPVNVAHNVSFLVGNCMMKNKDDLKCDDMGVWKRTGSPSKWFSIKRDENNDVAEIVPLQGKPGPKDDNVYQLRRIYYVNGSDRDVRKVISTLQGKLPVYVPCETEIHFSIRARREGTSAHNRSIFYRACANYVSVGTRAQHARANCTRKLLTFFASVPS